MYILPIIIQKYMKRSLYNQLYDYFDKNVFSKYQWDFRKGFSKQDALLVMLEKMKITRDRKGFCAAVLILTVSVMISSLPS